MNAAQKLLNVIGGTASLVAGYDGMYWSDKQFEKKKRQRPHMPKKGTYGVSMQAHFDKVRRMEKKS